MGGRRQLSQGVYDRRRAPSEMDHYCRDRYARELPPSGRMPYLSNLTQESRAGPTSRHRGALQHSQPRHALLRGNDQLYSVAQPHNVTHQRSQHFNPFLHRRKSLPSAFQAPAHTFTDHWNGPY